jgi:glycerophosphoryl diester phosphodiesterase
MGAIIACPAAGRARPNHPWQAPMSAPLVPSRSLGAPPRPLCVAHRGGAGLAPENTLAACRHALDLGVDAVEIDVRLTHDGVPVALHDAALDRTTRAHGLVADWPAARLRALDAGASWRGRPYPPEPPPALAAVLALVAGRAAVHVELKGDPHVPTALVRAVVAALHQQPNVEALLLSFDWEALRLARRAAPDVPRGALADHWPADAAAVFASLAAGGVAWLGLRYAALTPARRARVRAAGLRLGVWTVNHPLALRRAVALGVDAITTDRPDRLAAALAAGRPSP